MQNCSRMIFRFFFYNNLKFCTYVSNLTVIEGPSTPQNILYYLYYLTIYYMADHSIVQGPKTLMIKQNSVNLIQLNDSWFLQCIQKDLTLTIAVFKLDSVQLFRTEFKSIPQEFKIFIQTFAQFKQLLQGDGITFTKNKLIIKCQFGTKKKNIQIQLKQDELPLQKQVENLKILCSQGLKKQIQINTKHENIVKQLQKANTAHIKRINQLEQLYKNKNQQLQKLQERINEFNKDYVNCSRWTCNVAIAKKNIKHHKQGRKGVICDDDCRY